LQAVGRRRPIVALATYDQAPGLAPDDRLLLPALDAAGVDARCVVWSNADAPWQSFDAVIIRSCWDYHLRIGAFLDWLDHLDQLGIRVFNPPALVRWNANKRYLVDLAGRGAATVPTRIVPAGHASDVERLLACEGWTHAVIKPAVSASGYETYAIRAPLDSGDRAHVERVASAGDALLQPFADEIPRDGELSFIFFDGAFSHAAIKRAGGSEFRVQTEHGGSVAAIEPPSDLVRQAGAMIALLPEAPLYARVDGIARDGAFLLMELELIEPNLFFEYRSGAAEMFAAAVARRLHE
jgi:glutathione synthase/RimK-type ligase-like ATP-grasp enzyme